MQQYHREATMLLCVYPCLHQPRADLIVFQIRVNYLYNICTTYVYTCIIIIHVLYQGLSAQSNPSLESGNWKIHFRVAQNQID